MTQFVSGMHVAAGRLAVESVSLCSEPFAGGGHGPAPTEVCRVLRNSHGEVSMGV